MSKISCHTTHGPITRDGDRNPVLTPPVRRATERETPIHFHNSVSQLGDRVDGWNIIIGLARETKDVITPVSSG